VLALMHHDLHSPVITLAASCALLGLIGDVLFVGCTSTAGGLSGGSSCAQLPAPSTSAFLRL
jgi:hypothetical protein